MLQGLFCCDSVLRVISQKLHPEVYASVTDKPELLSKLWWLEWEKRNRLGEWKSASVIVRPRVLAGWAKQFKHHRYYLDFTFRLEKGLFEDQFCENASDGPHVYRRGVGSRAEQYFWCPVEQHCALILTVSSVLRTYRYQSVTTS